MTAQPMRLRSGTLVGEYDGMLLRSGRVVPTEPLWACASHSLGRKIIVITDDEPDDKKALDVLASAFSEKEILFIGTSGLETGLKKAIVTKILSQLGLSKVLVHQGSGGSPELYNRVNSTKAATSYKNEGVGLLEKEELQKIKRLPHSSDELQIQIEKTLQRARDKSIEIAMLAPPTDLVKVLNRSPFLAKKIQHIHIMGGWKELQEGNLTKYRTSYNWDMDPEASASLMQMKNIPMTLYSTHMLVKCFKGGSIHIKNFPRLIDHLQKGRSFIPSLDDAFKAGLDWNTHIVQTIPTLKEVIEPYLDHQFTPADPLVIIGMLFSHVITKAKRADIRIDLSDQTEKGWRVDVMDNENSNIRVVEEVDTVIFEEGMVDAYEKLKKKISL